MTITEITLAALIVVQWLTVVRQNKEINHRRECERLLKEKIDDYELQNSRYCRYVEGKASHLISDMEKDLDELFLLKPHDEDSFWRKVYRLEFISNVLKDFAKGQDLKKQGNDSNLLIVFYVQIMPDDFVMQLHRF
ncbi:hypothetical protein MQH03_24305 (plasmid) [Enterobacter cloacae]|uniref:hypothetical protein n=1 Tax=Enterobacter cloacae TaxID=550 RepID=UPI00200E7B16|nr:hypothetical protein [Enterobacter cloacae]UPW34573.1 hypothetical protein MQH03_24305 [Enterobacter cloacae]